MHRLIDWTKKKLACVMDIQIHNIGVKVWIFIAFNSVTWMLFYEFSSGFGPKFREFLNFLYLFLGYDFMTGL